MSQLAYMATLMLSSSMWQCLSLPTCLHGHPQCVAIHMSQPLFNHVLAVMLEPGTVVSMSAWLGHDVCRAQLVCACSSFEQGTSANTGVPVMYLQIILQA